MILADAGNCIKKPQLIFNVLRQSISKNILEKEWPRKRSCLDFESRHRRRMDENRKNFIHCGRAGAFWRAANCFKENRRFRPRVSKRFFSFPSRSRPLPCCGLENGMAGRAARLFAQTEFCLRKHIRRQRPFFSGANIFDDMGWVARADDHRADTLLGQGKTQQKIVQILPGIKEF